MRQREVQELRASLGRHQRLLRPTGFYERRALELARLVSPRRSPPAHLCVRVSAKSRGRIDCQMTANHARTGPITTNLVSKKTLISCEFCCVVIVADRPWNHS